MSARCASVAVLLLAYSAIGVRAQESAWSEIQVETDLVPSPVEVGVLLPPGYDELGPPLPLVLFLHGGGGSKEQLSSRFRPTIEEAWERGTLPPVVFATPSAGRSFYMDYRDGSESWESFIMADLLSALRSSYHVSTRSVETIVSGISMGGMGSLRLAFKHPNDFGAVVALEPAIEPSLTYENIDAADRTYRSEQVYQRYFGTPVDTEYWQANHPPAIALDSSDSLKAAALQIYIEVGDRDRLGLFRGAEALHRILYDGGVDHEYRLVRGADHVGPTLFPRLANALDFIARYLGGELASN